MKYSSMRSFVFALALLIPPAHAQINSALLVDPNPDLKFPARNLDVTVPSHGTPLPGIFYLAEGNKPHPTVLLLNGSGSEQNGDLAQTLRRAGWNVLAVHSRGTSGVPGVYTPATALEDAEAETAFVQTNATTYFADLKKIVPLGYSEGATAALALFAQNPQTPAVVLISLPTPGAPDAPKIAARPVLLFSAEDGSAPQTEALLLAVKPTSPHSLHMHMRTDHNYATLRIALQSITVDWLARQFRPER
jgi:dienelactone hydrolase